jgi:RNA polymerase sigma-70 factor (ECF subfamily)
VQDLDRHLEAIVAGDPDAFALWVAGAEPRLRSSLRSFAASVDTEAVLQETLLRAWQVAPRCAPDGRPNGLLRLALRIARNLAVDETRRRRPELAGDDKPLEPAGDDPEPPDTAALERWIAECLRQLARQPRRALDARLDSAGALPDRALAERLGQRLETFLRNLRRARQAMAECLRRKGADLEAWTS